MPLRRAGVAHAPRAATARAHAGSATAALVAIFMLVALGRAQAQETAQAQAQTPGPDRAQPEAPSPEPRRNYFDDPFVQATAGIANCPVPEGPLITLQEMRAQAHGRVDRGTTCFRSGRCRLPNSYQYDRELVPRVRQRLASDERFASSSVWLTGQRRWIYLQGCVATQEQADTMERAVREVDDVEAVIPELMVGTHGNPRYRVAEPGGAGPPAGTGADRAGEAASASTPASAPGAARP